MVFYMPSLELCGVILANRRICIINKHFNFRLSLRRRQCGHRYRHFVAGRDLPTKEFATLGRYSYGPSVYWRLLDQ